jgi:hypothetical protein
MALRERRAFRRLRRSVRRRAEGATLKELSKSYNVSRSTISRLSVKGVSLGRQ